MTATLPKSITIIGRRWFQRGPGNTYHTAEIVVDGEFVEGVSRTYGYGDQYVYSAMAKLKELGLIGSGLGDHESPWSWAERVGVKLTYSYTDVTRKKDL